MPDDKKQLLLDMIRQVKTTKKATIKFLEKLIGRLQHASQIIFPGKAFVRKLEALLYSLLHLADHNSPTEYPI